MPVNDQPQENLKEEEPFGLGCALEHFSDYEEVFQMIDNLRNVIGCGRSVDEKAYEKFTFILNQYIEQPHLIDSQLDTLLEKFILTVRNHGNSMKLRHLAFKYMFVVVNVRGYKVITRHLPHEVTDFQPVLKLLEAQDPNDSETWTTRYILLLWLSIIVMIPFHMSRFDASTDNENEEMPIMDRVLAVIKTYAVVPDKCRDAAAHLSYKFITRNDVKEKHLSSFLEWVKKLSLAEDSTVFVRYGTLACVATILKHGKREDLLPHATDLLQWIVNAEFKNNSGSNVQKLVYKIIQRIGLTFLPPRVAAWRYKRGNRTIAENLSSGDGSLPNSSALDTEEQDENDDDIEIPEEIEEVIDQLLEGLRSIDGVVRWSAAKGIGRVTSRLPREMADEVVGSVLELFNLRETDSAWHGGCIALAELGRRGLLLPDRLPQVVPVVLKALVYDEPRGYSSVGSHIRDAACYVCWSFSRAYESHILAPYVREIASALLVVTCFDKEINCRRAASAAFQENVGRQGTFPHGIDILTMADFFSVSVRNNAYLVISVYIAQFEEYKLALINHLLTRKVDHWDINIRELTAKALHNLTPKAPEYMKETVLPALFEKSNSIDLNSRHGSVLAIGEILYALSKISKENSVNIEDAIPSDILGKTENLLTYFSQKLYFRGLGGELMRIACSDFIEKCSLASIPIDEEKVIDEWLLLLNECLAYEVPNVRAAAVKALPSFVNEYFYSKTEKCSEIVKNNVHNVELPTSKEFNRMGHCLALGALPKFVLLPDLDRIVSCLSESTVITPEASKWAESRRDAIKALTSISVTMADSLGKEFTESHLMKIFHTFFRGLKDYTQDKRGDIGAWVREASVLGLHALTELLTTHQPKLLTEDLMNKILPGIAQQALEKIDRTRALAGKTFCSFLYSVPQVPNILYLQELHSIFLKEDCDNLNWNSASSTFPKFVQLVDLPPYTYNIMLGLVCSIGGLAETLVKHSSSSLFTHLKSKETSDIQTVCDTIHKIFMDNQKNDRVIMPMFRFLEKLFDSGCIEVIIANPELDFIRNILKLIQMELNGSKDIYKLIDGITVLCQFIQVKDVCDKALVQLSILLCHPKPYVRKTTATKLYESLLIYGDSSNVDPEKLDELMNVLSTTNWERPVEEVRPVRNQLCNLMGVSVPVSKKKVN